MARACSPLFHLDAMHARTHARTHAHTFALIVQSPTSLLLRLSHVYDVNEDAVGSE